MPGKSVFEPPRAPRGAASASAAALHAGESDAAWSDPPTVNPLVAVRRNWPLALAPILILVVAALAFGFARTPVFTAHSRLSVGQVDVPSAALPGYVSATQSLAASYSRAVESPRILRPVARAQRITLTDAANRLTATPIPDSPVIDIAGTGSNAASAVGLANSASDNLLSYVRGLNAAAADTNTLLTAYHRAALQVREAQAKLQRLYREAGANPSPSRQASIQRQQAYLDSVQLQQNTLGATYQDRQQNQAGAGFIQVLGRAVRATSDRTQKLELLAVSALVAGAIIGVALATFRATTLLRRATA